jgi:hypothetical protein
LNVETLLSRAKNEGLQLKLTERGTIKVEGTTEAIEKWTPELRTHKAEIVATLQGQQAHALQLAKQAIERAALTDEQKQSRLADLAREPSIARFWAQIYRDDQQTNGEEK